MSIAAVVAFAACQVEDDDESLSTETSAATVCYPACGGCATPDPFVYFGGGTCVGGGWLFPGDPNGACCVAAALEPPPPPPPCTMNCGGCATPDPFAYWGGGTCVNGGWLFPGDPNAGCCIGAGPPPPPPQPQPPPPPPGPASPNRLAVGESLHSGESITSVDGHYRLIYQGDGNLVLLSDGVPIWATMTQFTVPGRATLRADGDLVVVDGGGTTRWDAGATVYGAEFLHVNASGDIVVETTPSLSQPGEARAPNAGECRMTVKSHYAFDIGYFVHDAAELTFGSGNVSRLNLQAGDTLLTIGKCQTNDPNQVTASDYRVTYSEVWSAADCEACKSAYLDEVGERKPYVAGQSNAAMARCFDAAHKSRLPMAEPKLPLFIYTQPFGPVMTPLSTYRTGQGNPNDSVSPRCHPTLEASNACNPAVLHDDWGDCSCVDPNGIRQFAPNYDNMIAGVRRQCFNNCIANYGCWECDRICGVGCEAPKICPAKEPVCGPTAVKCMTEPPPPEPPPPPPPTDGGGGSPDPDYWDQAVEDDSHQYQCWRTCTSAWCDAHEACECATYSPWVCDQIN